MGSRKLSLEQAEEIRARYRGRNNPPIWQLARDYGIAIQTVHAILQRRRYTGNPPGRIVMPWTVRIRDMLRDGQVVDSEELIAEAAAVVPPGRALREADHFRKSMAARRGRTIHEKPVHGDTELQIRSGQRRIVQHSLADMVKSGRLIREDRDGRIWYRLGPLGE